MRSLGSSSGACKGALDSSVWTVVSGLVAGSGRKLNMSLLQGHRKWGRMAYRERELRLYCL